MKIRTTKTRLYLFIMFATVILFPYYFRSRMLGGLANLNFVFWFMLFLVSHKKGVVRVENMTRVVLLYLAGLLFLVTLTVSSPGYTVMYALRIALNIMLPTVLLFLSFEETFFYQFFTAFRGLVNIVSVFVLAGGVADMFSNYAVSRFFTNFYLPISGSLNGLLMERRIISYYGHSLNATVLFMLCFFLNYLYFNESNITYKSVLWSSLSFIGVAFTGSKVGIIVLIASALVLYVQAKHIRFFFLVFLIIFFLYEIGVFDLVIGRFMEGVRSGDMTTGRLSSLRYLAARSEFQFSWFSGQYIAEDNWRMIAALEFPVLGWAYKFGIAIDVFLIIVTLVIPLIRLMRKRDYKLFFCCLAYAALVHTTNGLHTLGDDMLLYCLLVTVVLNMKKSDGTPDRNIKGGRRNRAAQIKGHAYDMEHGRRRSPEGSIRLPGGIPE